MENATEALKIAAAVLVFVLALSISIGAFGQARQSVQIILDYEDREYDYTYVEEGRTERRVGLETIIPSIYKAYKENYKIVFDTSKIDSNKGLYQKRNDKGQFVAIFSIDLENEVLGNDAQKEEFIEAVLYGASSETKNRFLKNLGIMLNTDGIYDIIKQDTFVEKLGVYYQEEIQGQSESPDANKTKKRVITYADN